MGDLTTFDESSLDRLMSKGNPKPNVFIPCSLKLSSFSIVIELSLFDNKDNFLLSSGLEILSLRVSNEISNSKFTLFNNKSKNLRDKSVSIVFKPAKSSLVANLPGRALR